MDENPDSTSITHHKDRKATPPPINWPIQPLPRQTLSKPEITKVLVQWNADYIASNPNWRLPPDAHATKVLMDNSLPGVTWFSPILNNIPPQQAIQDVIAKALTSAPSVTMFAGHGAAGGAFPTVISHIAQYLEAVNRHVHSPEAAFADYQGLQLVPRPPSCPPSHNSDIQKTLCRLMASTVVLDRCLAAVTTPDISPNFPSAWDHVVRSPPLSQRSSVHQTFRQVVYSDHKVAHHNDIITWCRDAVRWQGHSEALLAAWDNQVPNAFPTSPGELSSRILDQIEDADRQNVAGMVKGNVMRAVHALITLFGIMPVCICLFHL